MLLVFSKVIHNNKFVPRKKYLDLEKKIIYKITNKYLKHNKNGKPYINNKNIKLSITNNNKIIIIAFHNKNVGIDLQIINKKKLNTNKTILFSMKEALYKANNINFQTIDNLKINMYKKNIITINNKNYKLYSKVLNNYVLSICYEI